MDKVEFIISRLTPQRIKILSMLRDEMHPTAIARRLNLTRQAVDKHLKVLHELAMVDRIIKYSGRIQIFYRMSDVGDEFLMNFRDVVNNYVLSVKKKFDDEIRSLDEKLVYGEINEREYRRKRSEIEGRFKWLMW